MGLTAPLAPKWLPPSQVFWGYATGVLQVAAGVSLITGAASRLAAVPLTVMYALFILLIHLPMLLAAPSDHFIWSENALSLVLIGVAWVVADTIKGFAKGGRYASADERSRKVS